MKNPFANLFKKKPKGDGGAPVPQAQDTKKKEGFFSKFFKNRLGKSAVQGEEIVGVELTPTEIRLAQLSTDKSNKWVLEKFFTHKIEDADSNSNVLDEPDKYGEQLQIALQKSKIQTSNAAIAIPVTSAIIRVVTAPLMTDEELNKAIDTAVSYTHLTLPTILLV